MINFPVASITDRGSNSKIQPMNHSFRPKIIQKKATKRPGGVALGQRGQKALVVVVGTEDLRHPRVRRHVARCPHAKRRPSSEDAQQGQTKGLHLNTHENRKNWSLTFSEVSLVETPSRAPLVLLLLLLLCSTIALWKEWKRYLLYMFGVSKDPPTTVVLGNLEEELSSFSGFTQIPHNVSPIDPATRRNILTLAGGLNHREDLSIHMHLRPRRRKRRSHETTLASNQKQHTWHSRSFPVQETSPSVEERRPPVLHGRDVVFGCVRRIVWLQGVQPKPCQANDTSKKNTRQRTATNPLETTWETFTRRGNSPEPSRKTSVKGQKKPSFAHEHVQTPITKPSQSTCRKKPSIDKGKPPMKSNQWTHQPNPIGRSDWHLHLFWSWYNKCTLATLTKFTKSSSLNPA